MVKKVQPIEEQAAVALVEDNNDVATVVRKMIQTDSARVAVLGYTGSAGKTTIACNLLAPRLGGKFYSVETINESAKSLGVEAESWRGNQVGQVLQKLIMDDIAIIDIGTSNIEAFLQEIVKYEDGVNEFGYYVIPVTPNLKAQIEAVKTIMALRAIGVSANKIRVLFNQATNFANLELEYMTFLTHVMRQEQEVGVGNFAVININAVVEINELFDDMATYRTTIDQLLADSTDYRKESREKQKSGDAERAEFCSKMHIMQSMARRLWRNLDKSFVELFA
jgi:hypothetical protein